MLGLVAGTRAADVLTTYWATPDLRREANPIVAAFNLDWTGLFVLTAVAVVSVMALYGYALAREGRIRTGTPGQGALEVMVESMYGPGAPRHAVLWRMPLRGRRLVSLGWYLPPVLVVVSVLVTVHNLGVAFLPAYSDLLRGIFAGAPRLAIPVLLALWCFVGFAVAARMAQRHLAPRAASDLSSFDPASRGA